MQESVETDELSGSSGSPKSVSAAEPASGRWKVRHQPGTSALTNKEKSIRIHSKSTRPRMIFSRVPLGSLFCQVEVSSLGPSSGTAPSVNSVNSVRNSFGNAAASQTLHCLCWFFAMSWSPFAVFWRDLKIFEFSAPFLQSRQSHFTLFVGCTPRCYWGRAHHGNAEPVNGEGCWRSWHSWRSFNRPSVMKGSTMLYWSGSDHQADISWSCLWQMR